MNGHTPTLSKQQSRQILRHWGNSRNGDGETKESMDIEGKRSGTGRINFIQRQGVSVSANFTASKRERLIQGPVRKEKRSRVGGYPLQREEARL